VRENQQEKIFWHSALFSNSDAIAKGNFYKSAMKTLNAVLVSLNFC